MMFLCDVPVATRSWWNSWWKYRRPYSTLRYFSGLWSSTSTFQFLVVEGETSVFKVLSQNRVQQRLFLLQNALLSGLWSRSLVLLVEVFKIFAQSRVHPHLLGDAMNLETGVLGRTFPYQLNKKCETGLLSALESESARQCQLIHASSSAHTSHRLGHDPHGSGSLLLGPPHGRDTLANGGRIQAFLVAAA